MQNKRILARIAKKKTHHINKIKEIRTFHAKDYSSIVNLQLMRKFQGQGEYSCSKCDVELSYTELTLTLIALINIFLFMSFIPKPSEMYLQ